MLRISHHKNVNKSENRLTPFKLYNKKHNKKVRASREGLGWGDPVGRPEEPCPVYYQTWWWTADLPPPPHTHTPTLESEETKHSTLECKENSAIMRE